MLKRKYDPTLPYRYAEYGRMSDPGQNRRSPDQQFNTIGETIERNRYPWHKVRSYRDDGISGRYVRKRLGLQAMLRDIAAGLITVDLVALDTYERLGRADEIAVIRQKLMTDHGVLVVSADNNFADPTGVVGQAVGFIEHVRATEHGRVKCHDVVRGKKDAGRQGRWPGGPRPFGLDFNRIVDESGDEPEIYTVLVSNPDEARVQRMTFDKAEETGWGCTRLARWYNANPEIPDRFKPVSEHTLAYRLSNPINIGTLVWGKNCTGIVNDTRVVEPNPEDEVLRIENFCEAIIPVALFESVNSLRQTRSKAIREARRTTDASNEKLIEPLSRGITLKYLLSGIARCGHCGAAMRPVPSGRTSKAGRRYLYYSCPRHYCGACDNDRSIPEDRLRETVVARVRNRLFPSPEREGDVPDWFPDLVEQVEAELKRFREGQPDRSREIEREIGQIDDQMKGWAMSLGNPSLAAAVRSDIESNYAAAKDRKLELEATLEEEKALDRHVAATITPRTVLERLQCLDEVLGSGNATLANLELSRHIERIDCHRDGGVVMRGTLLGLFEGAVELLSRESVGERNVESNGNRHAGVRPRRRSRRRIDDLSADGDLGVNAVNRLLDPERFANLASEFMWEESFFVGHIPSWAEEHAVEVGERRLIGLTVEQLCDEFDKTPPTIRRALRLAADMDERFRHLPRKMPRARWHEDHAREVAAKRAEGLGTNDLAAFFGKSDTTIRKALAHAATLNRNGDSK